MHRVLKHRYQARDSSEAASVQLALKNQWGESSGSSKGYFCKFGIQVSSVLSAETGFISTVAGSITVAGSSSTTIHVLHIFAVCGSRGGVCNSGPGRWQSCSGWRVPALFSKPMRGMGREASGTMGPSPSVSYIRTTGVV